MTTEQIVKSIFKKKNKGGRPRTEYEDFVAAIHEGNAPSGPIVQTQAMPSSLLVDKFEKTHMIEDSDETDTYMRNMLTCQLPDPPLFEADEVRRDCGQVQKLNLLHGGARSNLTPRHPDAFLGEFAHDPIEPDMRKHTDMMRYRYKRFTKWYSDSDASVPETPTSEKVARKNQIKVDAHIKPRLEDRFALNPQIVGRPGGAPNPKHSMKSNASHVEHSDIRREDFNPHMIRKSAEGRFSGRIPTKHIKTDQTLAIEQYATPRTHFVAPEDPASAAYKADGDHVSAESKAAVNTRMALEAIKRSINSEGTQAMGVLSDIRANPLKAVPIESNASRVVEDTLDHFIVESAVAAVRKQKKYDENAARNVARKTEVAMRERGMTARVSRAAIEHNRPSRRAVADLKGHEFTTHNYSTAQPYVGPRVNNTIGDSMEYRDVFNDTNRKSRHERFESRIHEFNATQDGDREVNEFTPRRSKAYSATKTRFLMTKGHESDALGHDW